MIWEEFVGKQNCYLELATAEAETESSRTAAGDDESCFDLRYGLEKGDRYLQGLKRVFVFVVVMEVVIAVEVVVAVLAVQSAVVVVVVVVVDAAGATAAVFAFAAAAAVVG